MPEYPAANYKHSQCDPINRVINKLYFGDTGVLRFLSSSFGCNNDYLFDDEIIREGYKNAQDSLFDLVHEQHNKFNKITDMEVDMIQEKSCLKPLLRPYQINAVKWMLRKENFNVANLDSAMDSEPSTPTVSKIVLFIYSPHLFHRRNSTIKRWSLNLNPWFSMIVRFISGWPDLHSE